MNNFMLTADADNVGIGGGMEGGFDPSMVAPVAILGVQDSAGGR